MATGRLIVAVTGASGAPYSLALLQQLSLICEEVYVLFSKQGREVMSLECGISFKPDTGEPLVLPGCDMSRFRFPDTHSFFSPPASGSFLHDGMVVIPCSMGTLGRIANGISNDLITRAADVTLKERRPLILVPRETPLNLIHLRNMAQVAEAGGTILPASPGFYNKPQTIDDLVQHVVARVLQQLNYSQNLVPEWKVENES